MRTLYLRRRKHGVTIKTYDAVTLAELYRNIIVATAPTRRAIGPPDLPYITRYACKYCLRPVPKRIPRKENIYSEIITFKRCFQDRTILATKFLHTE